MNILKTIGLVLVFGILFLACKTSKSITNNKFQKKAPFEIESATYQNWVGGQPGVKGVIVEIKLKSSEAVLDSIYFRNMRRKLDEVKNTSDLIYIGHFQYPNNTLKNIYHNDIKKEFGNEAPDLSKKIPFTLKNNEAVASYYFNGEKYYFMIKEIIEKEAIKY